MNTNYSQLAALQKQVRQNTAGRDQVDMTQFDFPMFEMPLTAQREIIRDGQYVAVERVGRKFLITDRTGVKFLTDYNPGNFPFKPNP